MKYVFLTIWWLFLLLVGPLVVLMAWDRPGDWRSYLSLGVVVHLLLCTWHLIREGYRSPALLGERNTGFWLCLLLLPLSLMPLHAAYQTWSRGFYVAGESSGRSRWIGKLLELLQDLVGHWGPIAVMLSVGLGCSLFLLWALPRLRR
ncbi:hypothetical protein [Pseudomonas alcaligenes]|uniref:hypothetical protein n=1 Tax=Aquipseudomonas alcaligenes TaxID=43263 RepID=UPI00358EBD1E